LSVALEQKGFDLFACDTHIFSEAVIGLFVKKGIDMNSLELMILVVMFFMIVIVTKKAFDSCHLFGSSSAGVMSVCVALLSVMGLHQAMGRSIVVILVPYAALAVVVFIYWLWALQRRCFRSRRRFSKRNEGYSPKYLQTQRLEKNL